MRKPMLLTSCLLVVLGLSACGRPSDSNESTRQGEPVESGEVTDVSALESSSANACPKSSPDAGPAAAASADAGKAGACDGIVVDGSDPATHKPGLVFQE